MELHSRSRARIAVLWVAILLLAPCSIGKGVEGPSYVMECLESLNVVWTSPSLNAQGSMPIGNGDVGLNVWVEPDGDLLFHIGKTDAWSENGRLLKLGRVRVELTPNPFIDGAPFQQELRLREGEIAIAAGKGARATTIRVWVDANRPVIRIAAGSESPFDMQVSLETWRKGRRELKDMDAHSARGLVGGPEPIVVEPDVIVRGQKNRIVWYHRNERSLWPGNLNLQALGHLANTMEDPLLHRTFGAAIRGFPLPTGLARNLLDSDNYMNLFTL